MAVSFSFSPRSKPKFAIMQKLTCRNSLFVAIAVIVFEVGFMTGRVGRHQVGTTVRGFFYQDFNISDFNIDSTTSTPTNLQHVQNNVLHGHNPSESHPLPLSLKKVFPLERNSPSAEFYLHHTWSQPLVLTAYMRHTAGIDDSIDVILITTGVSMGTFQRNFTAAGCLIGHHIFPVKNFFLDRAICMVPKKRLEKGASISLVIFKDDVVKAALEGPVTIAKEFVAELEQGDLLTLEERTILHGELKHLQLDELLSVKSRVVYDEQLDAYSTDEYKSLPRYEICLATQIKPSTYLLPDWLDYHRRIGVDFVYVFDNHAEEDVSQLLRHRRDVEVLYWPWQKSQIQAFTYAIHAMRARCEWLFLMDTDEYVMLGLGGSDALSKRELLPLKRYTREKENRGIAQIWFHWLIMKNSEYVQRPNKPVPDAYIHMEYPQLVGKEEATLSKTMVSMNYNWLTSNAHSKQPGEKIKRFDVPHSSLYPKDVNDTAMIVHYRKRSWVEFQEKVNSGRANINNPRTVSLLERWESKGKDDFKDTYMKGQLKERKVYTHFRNIWRRVSAELKVGKCITRRRKEGRWCRTVYDLANGGFEKPVRELCEE